MKTNEDLQQNGILKRLTNEDRAGVLKDGKVVHFKLKESVYEAETQIQKVYFPLNCVLSVVSNMEDGSMIEIGTIGHEGMTGIPLIMGSDVTANNSFCQVDGEAWEMSLRPFASCSKKANCFEIC